VKVRDLHQIVSRKPLDEGSTGPIVVENFGGGLCPAMDVSRLR
jgi:hypothetical protein